MACADEWLMNLAQILAQQGRFLIFFSKILKFSKIFLKFFIVAHVLLHPDP